MWQKVFREGFAPQLSIKCLEALRDALVNDDPRLIQGSTTTPPPLQCVQDWPVEAGCAIGYCGAIHHGGIGVATVGDSKEFFARLCFECDKLLGEPAGCRHFLNWFDSTPRDEVRSFLLEEVYSILSERQRLECGPTHIVKI